MASSSCRPSFVPGDASCAPRLCGAGQTRTIVSGLPLRLPSSRQRPSFPAAVPAAKGAAPFRRSLSAAGALAGSCRFRLALPSSAPAPYPLVASPGRFPSGGFSLVSGRARPDRSVSVPAWTELRHRAVLPALSGQQPSFCIPYGPRFCPCRPAHLLLTASISGEDRFLPGVHAQALAVPVSRAKHQAVEPPSTVITVPETLPPSGPSRYITAPAASSGSGRPSGARRLIESILSDGMPRLISVTM